MAGLGNKIQVLIVPIGALAVFILIGYFSYTLSYYITPIGSLLLYLLMIYKIFSKSIQYIIFPGSFWYYQANLETQFCLELAGQLQRKLKTIEKDLDFINTPNYSSASYYDFLTSFRFVNQIKENMQKAKTDYKTSKDQEKILGLLSELCGHFDEKPEKSLSEDQEDVALEELQGDKCLEVLRSLEKILSWYTKKSWLREKMILLQKKPFGDLDYMRSHIQLSINSEQIWVSLDDGCTLDCLYIKSQENNSGTVLYCNANAGLYEFTFYQNEWVSFYCELGLNVIIWNYRGYGRSQGTPDIKKIQQDGEVLINTLKSRLGLEKIAVHGESLGGVFACYLGKKCDLSFLFADRTFASIQETAFFRFGPVAYWLVKIFGTSDCDCVADYLGAKCYKLLASDVNDDMIPDLSSLKSGVCLRFLYPNYNLLTLSYLQPKLMRTTSHILGAAEMCNFMSNLKKLYKYDEKNRTFEEFLNKIDKIDACGKPVLKAFQDKYSQLSTLIWIIALDLWGCSISGQDFLNSHMKVVERLRDAVEEVEKIDDDNGVLNEEAEIVRKMIKKILDFFEEKCGMHGELEDFSSTNRKVDYAIVGRFMPLNCGHCGTLSYLEKAAFAKHFQVFLDNL